jgi:hypothetical protein
VHLLNKGSVGDAVALALAEYDSQVAERGIDEPGVVGESNRAMIEALIRGYALVSLPACWSDLRCWGWSVRRRSGGR